MDKDLLDEVKEEEKLSKKEQELIDSFNNSPLGKILDENNVEDIVLQDADHNSIRFQQVAVIPYDKTDKLYAILIPLSPMVGVDPGEGVLFEINENTFELSVVNDHEIIDDVLAIYMEEIEKEENDEPLGMEIEGDFEIGMNYEDDESEESISKEDLKESEESMAGEEIETSKPEITESFESDENFDIEEPENESVDAEDVSEQTDSEEEPKNDSNEEDDSEETKE